MENNQNLMSILRINEELNHLKDVDAILDKILFEARKFTNADAGSIFLLKDNSLHFSYVHNDSLFAIDETSEEQYSEFSVPITDKSIVGYAALTGETLFIDNAYEISEEKPFSFNSDFDRKSGYLTCSMLVIPLRTVNEKLVGVMQLINSQNEVSELVPFNRELAVYVQILSNSASGAIERGLMNRELMLRMMKMAELRDPKETGAHVQRVGAYSAEIYAKWASKRKISTKEMKTTKDLIRLAAMLHDVGKVGVPDAILKKPGKLTNEEYDQMKWHTVNGARLFIHTDSELDRVSKEIALNHHEKWDGSGYPGEIENVEQEDVKFGERKKGEEIPIAARITSLADVFDALSSIRSYKEAWTDERILETLKKDSGTHFDPELIEIFFEIFPVIKAIRAKYTK